MIFKAKSKTVESFRYRKRSPIVEAWQFTLSNYEKGAPDFIRYDPKERVTLWTQYGGEVVGGRIATSDVDLDIEENDWIVKGDGNEFYLCKPDKFEATYEKMEEKRL